MDGAGYAGAPTGPAAQQGFGAQGGFGAYGAAEPSQQIMVRNVRSYTILVHPSKMRPYRLSYLSYLGLPPTKI
jgi:hypothetical protein